MAKITNRTKEIVDTIATLEYPTQKDDSFSLEVYRNLVLTILPLLEMDKSAEEIAMAMCRECPKFGS